jgi:DNA-binding CsgD family transcriptional regulator
MARSGALNPRAKLTEAQVRELRWAYRGCGVTLRELALTVGVAHSTVQRAIVGINWAHVSEGA